MERAEEREAPRVLDDVLGSAPEVGGRIVDDLFDGEVNRRFHSVITRSDLRCAMRLGVPPLDPFLLSQAVRSNTGDPAEEGLRFPSSAGDVPLHRVIAPEGIDPSTSIDQLIEAAAVRRILLNPGLFLGVDGFANALHVDTATAVAQLESLLERGFIHRLGLLDRPPAQGISFSKTRVHPVNAAFSVEALELAGHDMASEPPTFAKVLRTFCIGQLIKAAGRSSQPTDCFHWRKYERSMREVDLVLCRDDRLVGITVRNSLCARSDTIGALRFLAKDERFARGFILYMGPFPRQLTENIWALPAAALWDPAAFKHE